LESLEERRLLAVIDVRVSASTDDAEQQQAGNIKQSSTDLEMVLDGSNVQTIGLRFTGISIPQGAAINDAYIQFQAKKSDSQETNLTIRGEDVDDGLTFSSTPFGISSRPQTTASASWSPEPWTTGQAGESQQTTDLSAIVQEIVNRPGWDSGNALVLIIGGSGKRVAHSFNGSPSAAPLLHVEFAGQNQIPIAVNDTASTGLNTPVTTDVLANDQLGDPPTSIINLTQPDNGSVVNNGDGTVTYTPDAGFSGNDSYDYTIQDSNLETSTATVNITIASQPTITLIDSFETWAGGIIRSTDVADLTYHAPSGHLYLVDSEIEEISSIFNGDNIFEVSLAGNQVFREITSNNDEPTGITYNEFDGFFYVTNDDSRTIDRYNNNLNSPLASVSTLSALSTAGDPEGITSNPATGDLYISDGQFGGRQVLVYNSALVFQYSFSVADRMLDAEGIAYNPETGTLFIVDGNSRTILEYLPNGFFLNEYDISGFSPLPRTAQGLAFAPTSNPNDAPGAMALYIADGGVDNQPDGRVYETLIAGAGLGSVNRPPQVDAGAGGITLIPNLSSAVTLDATALDDGFPNPPGTLGTTWSQVTGPGTVVFGNPSIVDTTAQFSAPGSYVLRLTANDGSLVVSDDVILEVRQGIERRIAAAADDAEESGTGNVSLTSSDLELVNDGSNQTVGLRFPSLPIPQGATITLATIQFRADEVSSTSTALTIRGHDVDDSGIFVSAKNNISSRPRTSASVAWSPPAWNTVMQAGPNQLTPNFASVVQEIVSRPDWTSGNSMSVIVTGSGKRVADSFDGEPSGAPLLRIEFSTAVPAIPLLARQDLMVPQHRMPHVGEALSRLLDNPRHVAAALPNRDIPDHAEHKNVPVPGNQLVRLPTRQNRLIWEVDHPGLHDETIARYGSADRQGDSLDSSLLDDVFASEAWEA
jgi:hypothetical protein